MLCMHLCMAQPPPAQAAQAAGDRLTSPTPPQLHRHPKAAGDRLTASPPAPPAASSPSPPRRGAGQEGGIWRCLSSASRWGRASSRHVLVPSRTGTLHRHPTEASPGPAPELSGLARFVDGRSGRQAARRFGRGRFGFMPAGLFAPPCRRLKRRGALWLETSAGPSRAGPSRAGAGRPKTPRALGAAVSRDCG